MAVKKEKIRILQKKLQTPNPKSFWTVVNNLLGKRHFDSEFHLKMGNGDSTSDPKVISETFASFFTKKVLRLARTIPERPKIDSVGPSIEFSMEELEKAIAKIKSKHCFGLNGIPLRVVRDFCLLMPTPALELMNDIAKNGLLPSQKTARILPLHKKGAKDDKQNYRPIANLCSITKVYEKLLLNRLIAETEGLEDL